MTVGPAASCGVCATPARPGSEYCPGCGSRICAAPAGAPSALPLLLAGCRRAGAGSRAVAVVVDALPAAGLVALAVTRGPLGRGALATLAVYLLGTWVSAARTGRTLGGLVAGLRLVDLVSGLPLGSRVPAAGTSGVALDVRRGRDPLRTVSQAPPLLPLPPAAQHPPEPAAPPPAPPTAAPPRAHAARPAHPPAHRSQRAASAAPPGAPVSTGAQVTTEDGEVFEVAGRALVGRNPRPRDGEAVEVLIPLNDLARSASKTHAALRWDGRTLWVTDRASTNGTAVTDPTGRRRALTPHAEEPVAPGSTLHLGDRTLTVAYEGQAR